MNNNVKSILKVVSKINPLATTMSDDSIAKVDKYISTGNYALNAKISADMYKGIACGRITTLFGPSQSGKSLLSAHIQKNAQDMGMTPIIFDSEFDKDGRMEKNIGVDTDNVVTIPVNTIEDVIVQLGKIFDTILENGEHGKYLLILDSLGALASEKQDKDVKKGDVAQDMGLFAKLVKQMYKTSKGKCAMSRCPLLVVNHEIADPNQKYESNFKKQGGGNAIEFFSTTMIHVSAKKEKQGEDEIDEVLADAKGSTSGQLIRFFLQKNRLAIPHLNCETYLNFITGWNKYSGLKDIATNLGLIRSAGQTYEIRNEKGEWEKIGYQKTWKYSAEFWEKTALPLLNPIVQKEYAYRLVKLDDTPVETQKEDSVS